MSLCICAGVNDGSVIHFMDMGKKGDQPEQTQAAAQKEAPGALCCSALFYGVLPSFFFVLVLVPTLKCQFPRIEFHWVGLHTLTHTHTHGWHITTLSSFLVLYVCADASQPTAAEIVP